MILTRDELIKRLQAIPENLPVFFDGSPVSGAEIEHNDDDGAWIDLTNDGEAW